MKKIFKWLKDHRNEIAYALITISTLLAVGLIFAKLYEMSAIFWILTVALIPLMF